MPPIAPIHTAVCITVVLTGCQPDSLVPQFRPWPSAITTAPSGSDGTVQPGPLPVLKPLPLPSPSFSPWLSPPAPNPAPSMRTTSMDDEAGPGRPSPARPTPTATPAPAAAPADTFSPRWSDTPIGQEPPGFTDPAAAPDHPAWLHRGRWVIAGDRATNGVVWQATDLAPQPYLSFRVRPATLPDSYHVTMAVRPIDSTFYRPPVGEIALIPHYRDATHYVEVVIAAERLSVWVVDGGQPGSATGWRGVAFQPVTTAVGQTRSVAMAVDRQAGRLRIETDGQAWSVTDDSLRLAPTGVAIRSSGNRFAVPILRLEPSVPSG